MKRLLILFILAALLLTGCFQKTEGKVVPPEPSEPKEEPVEEVLLQTMQTDASIFHFIADWLTETQIAFVEKENSRYYVKTFDIETGNIETLHEDSSIIVDVLIHPSKEYILLHTTDNPTSAIIKILSLDGTTHHELSIESSELAIEWNTIDPSLVLLTAFHQDWTFDVFLYDAGEEEFGLMASEDPFPKWLGTERIVTSLLDGHPLDGSTLVIHNLETETETEEVSPLTDIVYFDTYEESLLVVRITDEQHAIYSMMDAEGRVSFEWTMPAVSNYSEWVFPELTWVSEKTIFTSSPKESGQLDDLTAPYHLIRIVNGQQEIVTENDSNMASSLRCSPSGLKCLIGYEAEQLIDFQTGNKTIWFEHSN